MRGNPVGTNRYAYAGNDPVNKSDPNGHSLGPNEQGHTEFDTASGIAEIQSRKVDSLQWETLETAWDSIKGAFANFIPDSVNGLASTAESAASFALEQGALGRINSWYTYRNSVAADYARGPQAVIGTALVASPILGKVGAPAKGLGYQNSLYKAAIGQFKNTELSNAGRALTKHPEVIGETKETLRQALRTDRSINEAAHNALKEIMRTGVTTTPTFGRYGTVTQIQIPRGFGARWASDGSFIGFINP